MRLPQGRAQTLYLRWVGLGLLLQGASGLLVRATGRDPHALNRVLSDPMHSTIHLVWGAAMLLVVTLTGRHTQHATLLAFGVFYTGFLILGLLVHHPFGMQIDGKENAFHAVIAPLALIIWFGARHPLRG